MENTPLVSVLMPVYNGEKFVAEAIKSVLGQTYSSFELLICNDGSTDRTAAIITSFYDERIEVITHTERKGIPVSRNKLLRQAKGEFVAWLDADDIALPLRLENQVQYLQDNPQASVCFSCVWVFDEKKATKALFPSNSILNRSVLFYRQPFFFSSCMARKFPGVGFDPFLARAEDFDYVWKLAQEGDILVSDAFLLTYRLVPSEQKPDIDHTEKALLYIQKKKLQKLDLAFSDEQIKALNKFLRDIRNCNKRETDTALQILKAVYRSPNLKRHNLKKKYLKAIYVCQVLKAVRACSFVYVKHLRPASLRLLRELVKMRM